jgi:hypothetical protein
MPGITANLTNVAFAIWEDVPKKTRRPVNSMGGTMEQGRSAWLSGVIIDHHQEMKRFKLDIQAELDERLALMRNLRDMTASRDKLQAIVLELPRNE